MKKNPTKRALRGMRTPSTLHVPLPTPDRARIAKLADKSDLTVERWLVLAVLDACAVDEAHWQEVETTDGIRRGIDRAQFGRLSVSLRSLSARTLDTLVDALVGDRARALRRRRRARRPLRGRPPGGGVMKPSDVFTLLTTPEARPRTLAHLGADALALAIELTSAGAGDEVLALLPLDEAQACLLRAARLLEEAHEAMHAHRLAELEQLCVHCGHDRGEHLVDAPHACEHVELLDENVEWDFRDADGAPIEPCGCGEFVPPWTLDTRPTDRVSDTERPPAPETA